MRLIARALPISIGLIAAAAPDRADANMPTQEQLLAHCPKFAEEYGAYKSTPALAQPPFHAEVKVGTTGIYNVDGKLVQAVESFCNADAAQRDERYLGLVKLGSVRPQGLAVGAVVSAFVDRAIRGTAALVADRLQAELALWLMTDFSRRLCQPASTPSTDRRLHFETWFPKSCEITENVGEQPSGMLASAFRADLQVLPAVILVDLVGTQDPDEKAALGAVVATLLNLRGGATLANAYNSALAEQHITCNSQHPLACGMTLLSVLVPRIEDLVGKDGKITRDDMLAIATDADIWKEVQAWAVTVREGQVPPTKDQATLPLAAMALRVEQKLSTPGSDAQHQIAFVDALFAGDSGGIVTVINIFLSLIEDQRGSDDEDAEAKLERRARAFTDAFDLAVVVARLVVPAGKWTEVTPLVEPSRAAVGHFARAEWTEGGRDLLHVLVKLRPLLEARTEEGKKGRKLKREQLEQLELVSRTIGFLVDAANAKSPEEFKAALDSAAAPLGGWRRKTRGFVASFGAMAGITAGGEFLLEGGAARPGGYIAPTAMLGLDLAAPIGRRCKRRSSAGVFFSLIDVGQLASQRLGGAAQDDLEENTDAVGVDEKPTIGIREVFAPGAYARFGLAETPITILAGFNFAPDLRATRSVAEANPIDAWVLHVGLAVAVDITLFPFGRRR